MTRLEVVAVLFCFAAVGVGLLAWGLITIWHRRRRPEPRQKPVSMGRMAMKQRRLMEEVVEPAEQQAGKLWGQFGVHTDQRIAPGTIAMVSGNSLEVVIITNLGDLDDWFAGEATTWEFPEKWRPPSTLFDQDHVRPWAHV